MKKIQMNREVRWFIGLWIANLLGVLIGKGHIGVAQIYEMNLKHTIAFNILALLSYVIMIESDIDDFYRDMAICLGGSGMIKYLFLMALARGPVTVEMLNIQAYMAAFGIVYEAVFLGLAVFTHKKKTLFEVVRLNGVVLIVGLIMGYGLQNYIRLVHIGGGTSWLYTQLHMVGVVVFLLVLVSREKLKERVSTDAYEGIGKFLFLKFIQQMIVTIDSIAHNEVTLGIIVTLMTFSNYYIVRVFFLDIVKRSRENAYVNLNEEKINLINRMDIIDYEREKMETLAIQYKELLKILPDGIMIIEKEVIQFANDKMAQLFKLVNPVSLESKNIYNLIHPIDYGTFKGLLEKEYTQSLVLIHFSLLEQNFAGETKVFKTNKDTYIIIVTDITEKLERQRIENKLIEKQKEEKIKNQVLANISHEFKTPVNVIYAAAQLQEQNIRSQDWEGVKKYSPVIRLNCNRLIRLINNFIDLTRFDYGEYPIKLTTVNIVPVIEDITGSVVSFAENRGITVIFDTEEEELYCQIDVEIMDRIMLNLLSNAIKYNKVEGSIEVVVSRKDNRIGISVKDTGVGIEEDKIKILFNRFERIDKTLARDNEGSGLGLNIVKNMIRSLGGEIQVESTFKQGTTMTIYMPIVEEQQEGMPIDAYQYYNQDRLKKSVEMELSDIYE